jgi:intein/homing endonuclease
VGAVRHTQHTRARVIANFAETGRIDLACAAAGVDRTRHYDWLKDPKYRAAFEQARERAVDLLEAEAWRRAREGVEEPIVQGGRRVVEAIDVPELDGDGKPTGKMVKVERALVIRRYADQVLMFLLKGRKREVYGDKLEASGKDGSPLFPVSAVRAYMQSVPDDEE